MCDGTTMPAAMEAASRRMSIERVPKLEAAWSGTIPKSPLPTTWGEFKSLKAAAREAGIIKHAGPYDQLLKWWGKASAAEQEIRRIAISVDIPKALVADNAELLLWAQGEVGEMLGPPERVKGAGGHDHVARLGHHHRRHRDQVVARPAPAGERAACEPVQTGRRGRRRASR
jgi:hypothetical protein